MAEQPDLLAWRPKPAPRPTAPLLAHPLWPTLRARLKVEHLGKHRRLELGAVPADLRGLLLAVQVECAACGATINPVRRRAPAGRGEDVGHLYVSVACPLEVRVGCSRGKAAKLATDALAQAIQGAANDSPGATP